MIDAFIMVDALTAVNRRSGHGEASYTHRRHRADACCASVLAAPLDVQTQPSWPMGSAALADPVAAAGSQHPGRLTEGEVCVCDFVEPFGKSQPTVSHHLKILGEAGLVVGERRGKWVWYSLNRARLAVIQATLDS